MKQPEVLRVTTLAKTLNTFENALDSLVQSGMVCRPEEVEAFKRGFRTALDLVRKEYGIQISR